jgi:hypothetical protein
MRALRRHGVYAAIASLFGALVAFAGAYTAGEPTLSIVVAVAIAAVTAFLACLVVLAGGSRVVRRKGEEKSESGNNRAE